MVNNMLTILSNKLKRQLYLFELLFERETYRFQEIEKRLNCSSKTLRNDLNDLNSYAKEIMINMDRDSGVTVTIASHLTEDYIYRTILKESIEFRFLEAILLHPFTSYLELCEELFISESTLRRIVKKVNLALEKYQLKIRGLMKVDGKREAITQVMACLLQEKYTCLEEVFSQELCQRSRLFLVEFSSFHQIQEKMTQLDKKEKNLVSFYIASSLLQSDKRNERKVRQMNVEKNKDSSIVQYKTQIEQMIHHPFIRKILRLDQFSFDEKKGARVFSMIEHVIGYLEMKYQILCQNRTEVIEKIACALTDTDDCTYILHDRYRLFYQHFRLLIQSIHREVHHYFVKEKVLFQDQVLEKIVTWLAFYWPAVLKERENKKRVKALLVVGTTQYTEYIIDKLRLYLGDRYQFIKNDSIKWTEKCMIESSYDCIISTMTLSHFFNIPVFGISVMPKTREIHNLIKFHQQKLKEPST